MGGDYTYLCTYIWLWTGHYKLSQSQEHCPRSFLTLGLANTAVGHCHGRKVFPEWTLMKPFDSWAQPDMADNHLEKLISALAAVF